MSNIKTVKMFKPNQREGMPSAADVHPDEVANWQRTGWQLCDGQNEVPAKPVDTVTTDIPSTDWTVKQLRAYAVANDIELSRDDTRKDEILARILENQGNDDSAAFA